MTRTATAHATTPAAAMPSVAMSSVAMPSVAMPSVAMPSVAMPSVAMPSVAMPSVAVPAVAVPAVAMPSVAMPSAAMPTGRSACVAGVLAIVLASIAAPAVAIADARASEATVTDGATAAGGARGMPSVAEVVTAAYAASGLDREVSRGWIRRARIAGLVPWLTVQLGRDLRWQDELSTAAASSVTNVGHYDTFEVRATWRLDRLLFDGRELQVASIEAARRRERRRLASRVIRTYFMWRRAVSGVPAESALDDGAAGSVRVPAGVRAARADEAAAELDALTDGWFSRQLARVRRSASDNRTEDEAP